MRLQANGFPLALTRQVIPAVVGATQTPGCKIISARWKRSPHLCLYKQGCPSFGAFASNIESGVNWSRKAKKLYRDARQSVFRPIRQIRYITVFASDFWSESRRETYSFSLRNNEGSGRRGSPTRSDFCARCRQLESNKRPFIGSLLSWWRHLY